MYCRRCRYPIARLSRPRCPECGTPFDVFDPRSYRLDLAQPAAGLFWMLPLAAGWLLVFAWLTIDQRIDPPFLWLTRWDRFWLAMLWGALPAYLAGSWVRLLIWIARQRRTGV